MDKYTTGLPKAVRDSVDQTSWDPSLLFDAKNMYPIDPDSPFGGGWLTRGGMLPAENVLHTRVQRIHQFSLLDGTEKTLKVDAGEIYEFDWGTWDYSGSGTLGSWTKRISSANLTSASITLATTGLVYAVTFNDEVVFSDGTNTPFSWDGTAGGGLTKLTNAPVFYGQPVVYFAKLFGIKNTERSTIVWSEENDATTGYEAGGFNNAWTLGQVDQEPLYALAATEEALVYLRARSTGAIWGRANAEFQTTGTHEAISSTLGTVSPNAVVVDRDRVWFIDARGRPQRFVLGGADARPIWEDCRETIRVVDLDDLDTAQAVINPFYRMVQFGVETTDTSGDHAYWNILNFSAVSGAYLGFWTHLEPDDTIPAALDMVKDGDGKPVLMHGVATGQAAGGVYVYTDVSEEWYHDWGALNPPTVVLPIGGNHHIETGPLGYDSTLSKVWDRVDLLLRLQTDFTSGSLIVTTQQGNSGSISLPAQSGGTSSAIEGRIPVGLDIHGRWARFKINASTSGDERLGFFGVTAWAYNYDDAELDTA